VTRVRELENRRRGKRVGDERRLGARDGAKVRYFSVSSQAQMRSMLYRFNLN
jgi:hypothetical protein